MTLCGAKTRNGGTCRQHCVRGTNRCKMHGGLAPQTLAKARRRLLEAADGTAAELVRLAREAKNESTRVRAIKELLDRAGVKPTTRVSVDDTGRSSSDYILEQLRAAYDAEKQGEEE